ncbi:DMT family transporter [Sulfitobacter mediterraneus]|uniref:DMT family transporter n=1 Tax=Sulfitobacter mediterraneus TaxID=83219 RepID=UPI001E406E92|nr:DMT family transporter [Sulfitobacter mediterraneus]MCD2363990.1 DMT family transporter [Sulfitobacter mediterraneus]
MAPDTTPRITVYSWLMVATLAFVWGGTFMVTEVALRGITPFWLAASRIVFAALVMVAVWGLRGFALFQAPLSGPQRAALFTIGAASSAVPFSLLAWGQQHVTSGFAGVSMASTALIMLVLAHFFVPGERLTLRRSIGFAIGFCGVVVLIGGQAFETSGGLLEPIGRAACIGAACCYSVSSILMRRLPAVDPIGLATVLLLIAAAITVPLALITEGLPPLPDNQTLVVLAFLGLIPTAAANILRVLVVRSAGPVFMSLVNYQVPVWSVVLGAWILAEPMPPSLLYAMVLILAGVAISQFGALRRLFGRAGT